MSGLCTEERATIGAMVQAYCAIMMHSGRRTVLEEGSREIRVESSMFYNSRKGEI